MLSMRRVSASLVVLASAMLFGGCDVVGVVLPSCRAFVAVAVVPRHAGTTTTVSTATTTTGTNGVSSSRTVLAAAAGGPATIDQPATREETQVDQDIDQEKASAGTRLPPFLVRLWNDPYNKREFVARCLAEICGKSDNESFQIMMQAHKAGMGVVGQYDFEIAELYCQSLREHGLLVDMIPVEDE